LFRDGPDAVGTAAVDTVEEVKKMVHIRFERIENMNPVRSVKQSDKRPKRRKKPDERRIEEEETPRKKEGIDIRI